MNYRAEQKTAFIVRGYTKEMIKVENSENFYGISDLWSNLTEAKINQLVSISEGTIQGLLGVSDSNKRQQKQFNYTIGSSVDHEGLAKNDLNDHKFPASNWAVFECIGAISAGVKAIDEKHPLELNNLMQLKKKCMRRGLISYFWRIPRCRELSFIRLEIWRRQIISANYGFL